MESADIPRELSSDLGSRRPMEHAVGHLQHRFVHFSHCTFLAVC